MPTLGLLTFDTEGVEMTELFLASLDVSLGPLKTLLLLAFVRSMVDFLGILARISWSAVLERPTGACASSTLCNLW